MDRDLQNKNGQCMRIGENSKGIFDTSLKRVKISVIMKASHTLFLLRCG